MIKVYLMPDGVNEPQTYKVKPDYVLPFVERMRQLGYQHCDIFIDEGGATFVFKAKDVARAVRLAIDDEGFYATTPENDDFLDAVRPLLMPLFFGAILSGVRKFTVTDLWEKGATDYDDRPND